VAEEEEGGGYTETPQCGAVAQSPIPQTSPLIQLEPKDFATKAEKEKNQLGWKKIPSRVIRLAVASKKGKRREEKKRPLILLPDEKPRVSLGQSRIPAHFPTKNKK
jgi:hypothetical protein